MQTNTILFLGAPGAGKGTQAKLLASSLGWRFISSGDLFRSLRGSHSSIGGRVRRAYDTGQLLPSWFAKHLLVEQVAYLEPPDQGVVLDGFARTLDQAEEFHSVMTWLGRPYLVLELVVSGKTSIKRQLERAKKESRPDSDTEEKISARHAEQVESLEPALQFFATSKRLISLDGEESVEELQKAILGTVHALG